MAKKHPREHVDRRLRFRLQLYGVISLILLCIVMFDIVTSVINVYQGFLGIGLGVGVGIVSARMFHISWDKNAEKTVARLDIFGGAILVGYIVFVLFRNQLIGEFVPRSAISGVSLAVAAGIMIGRILGTRGKIIKILKEQNLL